MKITKFAHSCILIEEGNARILFDPGMFSTAQNELTNLDAVLITHEHGDHLDLNSVKAIVVKNPGVQIFTNHGVKKMLDEAGIACMLLEHGGKTEVKGVTIQGFGETHAEIYKTIPRIPNTGYLVGGRLFYPGDALFVSPVPVEILALPATAPWSKISETVDYAYAVKPKIAFPVHDAGLKPPPFAHRILGKLLPEKGIQFSIIEEGESKEF